MSNQEYLIDVSVLFISILITLILVYANYWYNLSETGTQNTTKLNVVKVNFSNVTNYLDVKNQSPPHENDGTVLKQLPKKYDDIVLTDKNTCEITVNKLDNEKIVNVSGGANINVGSGKIVITKIETPLIIKTNYRKIIVLHYKRGIEFTVKNNTLIAKNNDCTNKTFTFGGKVFTLEPGEIVEIPLYKPTKHTQNTSKTKSNISYFFVYGGVNGSDVIIKSNYNDTIVVSGGEFKPEKVGGYYVYFIPLNLTKDNYLVINATMINKTFTVPIVKKVVFPTSEFSIKIPSFVWAKSIPITITGFKGNVSVAVDSSYYEKNYTFQVNGSTTISIPYEIHNPLSSYDLLTVTVYSNNSFIFKKVIYVSIPYNLFNITVNVFNKTLNARIMKLYNIVVPVTAHVEVVSENGVYDDSIIIPPNAKYASFSVSYTGKILTYRIWFEYKGVRFFEFSQ